MSKVCFLYQWKGSTGRTHWPSSSSPQLKPGVAALQWIESFTWQNHTVRVHWTHLSTQPGTSERINPWLHRARPASSADVSFFYLSRPTACYLPRHPCFPTCQFSLSLITPALLAKCVFRMRNTQQRLACVSFAGPVLNPSGEFKTGFFCFFFTKLLQHCSIYTYTFSMLIKGAWRDLIVRRGPWFTSLAFGIIWLYNLLEALTSSLKSRYMHVLLQSTEVEYCANRTGERSGEEPGYKLQRQSFLKEEWVSRVVLMSVSIHFSSY